jgi:hypothetical protein
MIRNLLNTSVYIKVADKNMVESVKNEQELAVGDYKQSLCGCTYVRDLCKTSSFRGFRLKNLLLGDYSYFWTSFEGLLPFFWYIFQMPCQVFVDAKNEQDEFSCELFMIFLLSGLGHGYRLATKVAGLYAVHWFSRNRNNSSVRFRIAFWSQSWKICLSFLFAKPLVGVRCTSKYSCLDVQAYAGIL